ncbi:MAG: hypothetical protein ACTSX1_08250 [Candidatus Heimdallarchaeaceae archaeon]
MSNEKGKELETEEKEQEVSEDTPTPPQQLTPKQILDAYPNDKDKAINYLILGIQSDLNRIANILDYFASKDMAAEKAKAITKPS